MTSTMTIRVNGEDVEVRQGLTVRDLLIARGVRTQLVAVERNREIVPRARHAETVLSPGDVVEVVTLVGGG